MRILHITDSYEYTGGIQSYLKHLINSLGRRGHEAEIYSPMEDKRVQESYFSRWVSRKYYSEVRSAIDRYEPDILHAHSVSMKLSPLPLLAARKKSIPVVMTVHDFNYVCHRKWMIDRTQSACRTGFGFRCLFSNCFSSREGWMNLPYHNLRWVKIALHRYLLRRYVNTFICPSEALSQWMMKSMAVQNVVHIPNFIQWGGWGGETLGDKNRLLFVGRLSKEKGVDCLLKAMPLVMDSYPDTSLTIVGDGPEKLRLQRLSTALEINQSVHFAGMVHRNTLPAYYEAASISILPSLWMENCPVSGIEAMAQGKPIIGSNIGGIPEIVRDGETGFIFTRNDHEDLAEKIKLLLGDRALLNAYSENARSFFGENFTEEKHCKAIITVYKRSCNSTVA